MIWHSSFLQWLTKRQKDPKTIMAQKLSDFDQKLWQAERRRRKYEAQEQLREGAHLAELRDSDRKRYHDMSATEQRALEDFDCGKFRKLHDEVRVRKPEHCGRNSLWAWPEHVLERFWHTSTENVKVLTHFYRECEHPVDGWHPCLWQVLTHFYRECVYARKSHCWWRARMSVAKECACLPNFPYSSHSD